MKLEGGGGGDVEASDLQQAHVVINGENLHALKLLEFTHGGKIDAIFIDPPYNTGDKSWKYNNDYVDSSDNYRHSKWLAFMERRLKLAKRLLNPIGSVLIVTIDEKEYLRLGLLLEQIFPEAKGPNGKIQMISSVVNGGGSRSKEFGRVDEYIYFVWLGEMDLTGTIETKDEKVHWHALARPNTRKDTPRKNQFYPIYINKKSGRIEKIGVPLKGKVRRESIPSRKGCVCVLPIRKGDGEELIWNKTPKKLQELLDKKYVSVGKYRPNEKQPYVIKYLQKGIEDKIKTGEIEITSYNSRDGSAIVRYRKPKTVRPKTNWYYPLHKTSASGTNLLKSFVPGCKFPSPKSLYAVEDCLRLFLKDKPNAVVLDFFAGSGTTCHAVMKLNQRYGGGRQCISVTNNEVGSADEKHLLASGHRPGDPEWDKNGIFELVTMPRIRSAVRGITEDGKKVKGNYRKMDIVTPKRGNSRGKWKPVNDFPMSDGLSERVTFFRLTYEDRLNVEQGYAFERIAPLLWLKAGARGRPIDTRPKSGWWLSDTYGIIVDLDSSSMFLDALKKNTSVETVFVVTESDDRFQLFSSELSTNVRSICLWKSYVSNFCKGW